MKLFWRSLHVCARGLPCDTEADRTHVRQYVIKQVIAPTSGLQVDVEFGEFKLDVINVMEEEHKYTYVVVSEGKRKENGYNGIALS